MSKYELDMELEQQELTQQAQEAAEQQEGKEAVGYSSDYYQWQMENALEKGNKIAYDSARRNWAKAKAKEATGG